MFPLEAAVACNRRMIELLGLGADVFAEVCIAHGSADPAGGLPEALAAVCARNGSEARFGFGALLDGGRLRGRRGNRLCRRHARRALAGNNIDGDPQIAAFGARRAGM